MPTIDVKDAANATVAIEKPNSNGRAAANASRPIVLSNEDKATLDALATAALQTAANLILTSVDGKLPALVGGASPSFSPSSQITVSSALVRPSDTTAYAAGDLVANSVTAGSVVALSFANAVRSAGETVRIERVRIDKSSAGLINSQFRVHLFEDIPVPSVGDNAAFNASNVLATTNVRNRVGTFLVVVQNSGSDGASGFGVSEFGSAVIAKPTSGTTLYALIEAVAAYNPGNAESIKVTLEGYRT